MLVGQKSIRCSREFVLRIAEQHRPGRDARPYPERKRHCGRPTSTSKTIDPSDREQLRSVALSPISVVHLFRQYFFELDTFLGTPTGHVWPSPGSSVELIEVQTRREYVEKTLETTLDVVTRAEQITTQEDELSEAVKEDTQQDVKLGASVKASYASIAGDLELRLFDLAAARPRNHAQAAPRADREALLGDPQELQVDVQDRQRGNRGLKHPPHDGEHRR